MKYLFTLLILLFSLSQIYSQTVYATSLNTMYPQLEGEEYADRLNMTLSKHFDIKYGQINSDPWLKQKLIDELIDDILKAGYKLPKKKSKDYFNPYLFLLDLPINLDNKGNILSIKETNS